MCVRQGACVRVQDPSSGLVFYVGQACGVCREGSAKGGDQAM